jgi:uncharacterized protein involved in exopolysaccharide biosynthesis
MNNPEDRLTSLEYKQPGEKAGKEDTISLLDIIGVLTKRWKLIFFLSLAAAIFIVAYSLYTIKTPHDAFLNRLPNIYKPTVQVRLQEDSGSATSFLSSESGLGALAGLAGISGGGNTSVALAEDLLEGHTIIDQIGEEFDFKKRYKIEEKITFNTRKMIKEKLNTEYDSESGILTISYSDVDPKLATDIVNRAVVLLEARFRALTQEKVLTKKTFLEERLEEVETDLKEAQTNLIQFQIDNGIVNVVVNADTKSVELVFARYIPQAMRSSITLEYFDLERDKAILEGIYQLLMEQYETTKIEEMDDSKTFQILETAEVPEVKNSPSRGKICIIFTFAVFFVSILLAFIFEYFDKARKDPVEAQKLERIKHSFRSPKKR